MKKCKYMLLNQRIETDLREPASLATSSVQGRETMVARRFTCFAFALGLATSSALAQTRVPSAEQVLNAAQASFAEYFELLALPNDAIVPADIRQNTDWLERAFVRRGFTAQQLPNDGKPLLYAEYPRKKPGAKTVLFYMHLDGQPVLPEQWAQKSPWIAVVKKRNAQGEWEAVDKGRLQAVPLDPELRVFARASADDKGPIMMFLAAFDALKAAGLEPELNVKVLLDSEEEKGSPTIGRVAKANAALLRADALLIHDGPRHPSDKPTLIFGNRGNTVVTLTVYGPKNPLHSGHYGNYVPNPAQRLASLLASMKDDEGRVTIPGYYGRVELSDAERKVLAEVEDDEAAIKKRVGIAKTEAVGRNYQEALQYPSLNIRGMQAAAIGDKGANIVPNKAVAELDLRTTPEAGPEILYGLIEEHVRGRGWYLSKGEPTDAERAAHDKIASLTLGRGSRAARTPMDAPLGGWVYGALQRTFGEAPGARPVRIRMMGGSVPTDKLVDALEVPFVIIPLVNADNNQHSFDENLRIGHYLDGMRALLGLLRTPF
jgi:acetylornithine deacetylase/succinyl-diaminopimelate desuccinylase-like protein